MQSLLTYRGWRMAAVALASITLVIGSTTNAFGLFVTPVARDLGISRATMNGGMVCLHIGMAVIAPFVGRLMDRFPSRLMMAAAGVSLGVSYIVLGTGDALWVKGAVLAVGIPFAMLAGGPLAAYILLARWFRRQRGRAMAVAAVGLAMSSIVVTPLLAVLIEQWGWRHALQGWGVAVAILLFLLSRMIRERPGEGEEEPPARRTNTDLAVADVPAAAADVPVRYAWLLVQPSFYIIAVVIGITLAVVQALIASIVPLANGRGFGVLQSASLMSIFGVTSLGGMALLAVVADRFDRTLQLAIGIAIVLAFSLLLTIDGGFPLLAASTALGGLALSTIFPIYSAWLADRFGASSLGTVEGIITPVIAGFAAIAVHYAGHSFDETGGYTTALTVFAGALAVALMLLAMLRFDRRRERLPRG